MDKKNFDGIFQLSKLAASQAMEALEWWEFLVSMPITNHTSYVTITCFGVKNILLTDVQKVELNLTISKDPPYPTKS